MASPRENWAYETWCRQACWVSGNGPYQVHLRGYVAAVCPDYWKAISVSRQIRVLVLCERLKVPVDVAKDLAIRAKEGTSADAVARVLNYHRRHNLHETPRYDRGVYF